MLSYALWRTNSALLIARLPDSDASPRLSVTTSRTVRLATQPVWGIKGGEEISTVPFWRTDKNIEMLNCIWFSSTQSSNRATSVT